MAPVDVFLMLDQLSADDRKEILQRLRQLNARDFEFKEGGEWRLSFNDADPTAALVRAQDIVKALCDGTDIDPSDIRRSVEGWWISHCSPSFRAAPGRIES